MGGIQQQAPDAVEQFPFDNVKQYEDYIARLHQIPRALGQAEDTLRAGVKDGLMPVRFLLEKIPAQCDGIIAADPFMLPTKKYPDSISAEDQQRLTKLITDAVNNTVGGKAGAGNLISGNDGSGVRITASGRIRPPRRH